MGRKYRKCNSCKNGKHKYKYHRFWWPLVVTPLRSLHIAQRLSCGEVQIVVELTTKQTNNITQSINKSNFMKWKDATTPNLLGEGP